MKPTYKKDPAVVRFILSLFTVIKFVICLAILWIVVIVMGLGMTAVLTVAVLIRELLQALF